MSDLLQQAIALHRGGKLAEAEKCYREIVAHREVAGTVRAQALGMLGVMAATRGNLEEGFEWIRQGLDVDGAPVELWLHMAELERRRGRMAESIAALRQAAAREPANVYAMYNLAMALRSPGVARGTAEREEAERCFRRVVEWMPELAEGWSGLGVALVEAGRAGEAVACLEKARALGPSAGFPSPPNERSAEVENHLGWALWEAGRHEEAITAFRRAVAANDRLAPAWANLAAALVRTGKAEEGVEAYRQAVTIAPSEAQTVRELGVALMESGQLAEAESVCRRAVEMEPDHAGGVRALAVVVGMGGEARRIEARDLYAHAIGLRERGGGGEVPEDWRFEWAALAGAPVSSAPGAFVRTLFDGYALKFEQHVVGALGYRVPAELVRMVCEERGQMRETDARWEVLDLGCGTGLCGIAVAAHARRIVGVDLSPAMVEMARRRGVYSEVIAGDAVESMRALSAKGESFDVILAADVFVYVGALEALFAAAAVLLKAGGILAFSLEECEENGRDFVLTPQRRFAHSLAYVRAAAEGAGMALARAEPGLVRRDVPTGWWVVLRR
jgi:predicted TPR repeat methyltransferase